jgi:hypothetical protein
MGEASTGEASTVRASTECVPRWIVAGDCGVGFVWNGLGPGGGSGPIVIIIIIIIVIVIVVIIIIATSCGSYFGRASAGILRSGGEVDAGIFAHRHDESSGE